MKLKKGKIKKGAGLLNDLYKNVTGLFTSTKGNQLKGEFHIP